ncbi:DUF4148 domain-containing protein [Pandoraea terrigena]|uniref:DUF4148 domain-containing protein n=1 Tax=Pandoraea terrigena TaxID=2508292 RepID=A0A5E4RFS3_9BURK|nr:DUF4148 domain-containing protein [Pandoraea terrigena]VVD61384.1 hypothetical protein PTE31013_00118 [Pandoraea terrigena]
MKTSYVAALVAVAGLLGAVQINAQAAESQSVMSGGAPSLSLTRAQVYRQLVSAETRGLMQQGDTVYPETAMNHRPQMHVTRLAVEHSLQRAEQHGLFTQSRNAYPVVHLTARTHAAVAPAMQVASESSIERQYAHP